MVFVPKANGTAGSTPPKDVAPKGSDKVGNAPPIAPAAAAPAAEPKFERAKKGGAASPPPSPKSSTPFEHNPLYDDLTADHQVSAELAKKGIVSEWNGLNQVKVDRIVKATSEDEVRSALADARARGLRVSVSGARHSSGSQSISPGSVHLDMTEMRGVSYSPDSKTVTVKAGTNWLDVMQSLEHEGRSVAVKQEFSNFTVGGSVSVNCMGRDYRFGPVGNTVKSVKVMLADGSVVDAKRDGENADLFKHVVGGMGMFGVVLEAELETVPNERYTQSFENISAKDFHDHFDTKVGPDSAAHIFSGTLSCAPSSFMDEVQANTWRVEGHDGPVPFFEPEDASGLKIAAKRQMLNASRLGGDLGKEAFWQVYKHALPLATPKEGVRNDALNPPYGALHPTTGNHAQVLDVSVVPREQLPAFLQRVKQLQKDQDANVFMATVYPVKADSVAALRAVKEDSYVVTLAVDHKRSPEAEQKAKAFYKDVTEVAIDLGGAMYLTHQLPFSKEQILRAYPELPQVLAEKKKWDPTGMFDNVLVDQYGR